jgi:manganese-dependent inorganic pyrophosphatase
MMKRKEIERESSSSPDASKMKKDLSDNHLMALEEKDYTDTVEGDHIGRKRTVVEKEVFMHKTKAHEVVVHLPPEPQLPDVHPYIPQMLDGAIFCGHLVTDLDSIAGAIGAAELYSGTAARASEINSETAFALKYWGFEQPRPIEELLTEMPDAGVCLVDHQQVSQLNKSIDVDRIVGVIDHHALQNATIVTDKPIYIDIRPWGSMSTIIAHTFMTLSRRPTKRTAGLLLCAILSDTLNLCGPTTTEWDRLMVTILVEIAGVSDESIPYC